MSKKITVRPVTGTWVVRAGGAVLGESAEALEVTEDQNEPVIYFPRGDIAMEFLDESAKTSICPEKGEARYFSIVTKSTTLRDAVWSYEAPKAGYEDLAGRLAFRTGDLITVEEV